MTTTDRLVPVLRDALSGSGLLLEDVTVSPAGRRRVVRVVVDRDLGPVEVVDTPSEPLSLDDVSVATRAVNAALDRTGVMGEAPYTLEVTSPGISRPLVERRHFARNIGRLVTVVGPEPPVTGRVQRVDPDGVTLEVPAAGKVGAQARTVAFAEIRRGEVQVEFNRVDDEPGTDEDEES